MILLFFILLALLSVYALLMIWLSAGFIRTPVFQPAENRVSQNISIIICARNEEKTIVRCLKTITQQDYDLSKIQIILVNDASSDSTSRQAEAVLKNSGIEYLIVSNKERKGKKRSISDAIHFSKHDLIILRDADTYTLSYSWLQSISDFNSKNPSDLIIGPIGISENSGLLWAIQAIENNVLSVLNAGSAYYRKSFLCNGANLIFTKDIFEKVNGFSSHINIESGDDILFMEEIKKLPLARIHYLKSKEAIVYTYPCFSFEKLIRQKIRWASKFKMNPNPLNSFLAVLSFLINASWIFALFYGFFVPEKGELSLIFVLGKLIIDILLLFLASSFIKNRSLAWYVLPIGFIYPVYTIVIALASVFSKPHWK